jgi:hypothetical protein
VNPDLRVGEPIVGEDIINATDLARVAQLRKEAVTLAEPPNPLSWQQVMARIIDYYQDKVSTTKARIAKRNPRRAALVREHLSFARYWLDRAAEVARDGDPARDAIGDPRLDDVTIRVACAQDDLVEALMIAMEEDE